MLTKLFQLFCSHRDMVKKVDRDREDNRRRLYMQCIRCLHESDGLLF